MPIILRPCTTKAGFEALPTDENGRWDQGMRLDLVEVAKILGAKGVEVLEAGVLLVVQGSEICEVTIYPSGRLIIKTDDEAIAMASAEWVFNNIGL